MFITQCLYQFPNVYRHWLLETRRPVVEDLEELEFIATGPSGDPAGLVMIRNEVTHALEHYVKDERVRDALVLRAMGYTTKESAEMLGTTTKALDSAMQRHWSALGARRTHPGDGEGERVP
jgi:DNA-directed RNA polymerase specialized sigma24 family protein